IGDRVNRTRMFGLGAMFAGIVGAFVARAQDLLGVALPRSIGVVGSAAAGVPLFSLLADFYAPKYRGRVFSFLGLWAAVVGPVAGIILPGQLIPRFGWRAVLAGISILI